jgi:hypothetical protein
MTSADPACPTCAGPTERAYYAVAAIWTKGIAEYGDKRSEGYYQQQKAGGHWTMETDETGKVSKTFISTQQQNRDYCRRNGLINPNDIPSNLSIAKDGKSYETVNRSEI